MSILSVRIDKDIEEKLNLILDLKKIQDKSAYIRKLLSKSIQTDIIEDFCQQVKNGKISLWKAAESIGISLRAMMAEIGKREIILYDEQALDIDLKFADL